MTNMSALCRILRQIGREASQRTLFSNSINAADLIKNQSWRRFHRKLSKQHGIKYLLPAGVLIAATYIFYNLNNEKKKKRPKRRSNERYFLKYASLEYDGKAFMTPRDFLECILNLPPKVHHRIVLNKDFFQTIRRKTPSEGSSQFFSSLGNNGLVSYCEYIFLLTIIILPKSGIIFKMLDRNNDQGVDRDEFVFLQNILTKAWENRPEFECACLETPDFVQTTLQVHFFGRNGNEKINRQTFHKFVSNLLTEIFYMQFTALSHGLAFIRETEFAKFLISDTYMDVNYDYDGFISRMIDTWMDNRNIDQKEGITFEEFRAFFKFLYNTDEFLFAVKYFAGEDNKVSRSDFHRLFKVARGVDGLNWYMIEIFFNIFDTDNDGFIVVQDFVNIITNHLHKKFKTKKRGSVWNEFKRCVYRENRRNACK